jgi:hypothetical protein
VQRNTMPTGRPKPSVNIASHLRSPIPSKLQKFPIPHRRLRRIHFNMATGVRGGSTAAQVSGGLRGRVCTATAQVSSGRGLSGTGGGGATMPPPRSATHAGDSSLRRRRLPQRRPSAAPLRTRPAACTTPSSPPRCPTARIPKLSHRLGVSRP